MRVGLLGPIEIQTDEGRVPVPSGARPRALLARLALAPGTVVPRATLASALWGDEPPAANALHTVVSRLRRSLADGGAGAAHLLESHPSGYALAVRPDDVDAIRAERLAAASRDRLAAGAPEAAARLTAAALALWRGDPLGDIDGAPFAAAAANQLDELWLTLTEQAVEAALALGDSVDLVELDAVARAHPLREHLQVLLARALYAAGRQADALETYQRTRRVLADELGVDPTPELEETHLAILRQDDQVRTRRKESSGSRSRLPAQLTSFVGREHELDQVTDALRSSRLVTLVGPGGSGKTRLASRAAGRIEPELADGVFFVELAPVHDPAELPSTLLAVLGMRERALFGTGAPDGSAAADVEERLLDNLASLELLLVLDNCEHLVGAIAHLTDALLAGCPGVRVLSTTREALAITGERLCPLPPLAVPPEQVRADDAMTYAAVQLFTDRAGAVRPGFAVTDTNVDAVAQICRRLDGMPLAIELAAARMRAMSPEQIAERLDDRFRLLTGGSRTAVPRHQTLLAVVEWSWELLEKPERLLLERLAVFAGPVTLEDVEATCADDDLGRDDILDIVSALIDKSLVDVTDDPEVRYRLLETVRAFAVDRLIGSGDAERLRRRHAEHVLEVLRGADPLLRGGSQLIWLSRLDGLREDIVATLRWTTDTGEARLATGLVAAVGWYWILRSLHADLRHWPARVATLSGDSDPGDRMIASAFRAMAGLGEDTAGMRADAQRMLEEMRTYGEPAEHPIAALIEPIALLLRDEVESSERLLRNVIENHHDAWTRATARVVRSRIVENLGDGVTAEADEALMYEEYKDLGDRWGMALSLTVLADRYARKHEYVRAIAAYRDALDYMSELGTADDVAQTLVRTAAVHAVIGEYDEARAALDECAQMPANVYLPIHRAYTQAGYADVAFREGDHEEALRLYVGAVDAVEAIATPMAPQMKALLYGDLARVHLARGTLDEAARLLRIAYELAESTRDRPMAGLVIEGWADYAATSGDPHTAARLLGMSQAVFGTVESPNLNRPMITGCVRAALGSETYDRAYADGAAGDRDGVSAWMDDWLADNDRTR